MRMQRLAGRKILGMSKIENSIQIQGSFRGRRGFEPCGAGLRNLISVKATYCVNFRNAFSKY